MSGTPTQVECRWSGVRAILDNSPETIKSAVVVAFRKEKVRGFPTDIRSFGIYKERLLQCLLLLLCVAEQLFGIRQVHPVSGNVLVESDGAVEIGNGGLRILRDDELKSAEG